MPNPQEMRATIRRYLECVAAQDVDGVLALFSDSVSVEDPVGGSRGTHLVGREAVGTFFRKGFAKSKPAPRLTGPIRTTAADEAAMPFVLRLELAGKPQEVDVIDVIRFDASGKIASLRAFWNPAEIRPIREDEV